MRVDKIFITLVFILISSCGFKISNQQENVNFFINNIDSKGDKKINYHLKNNLFFNFKDKKDKPIVLKINTEKTKNVKEKNIKNEITKYQINININVEVKNQTNGKIEQFNVNENGVYNIASKYSVTLNNEKKLTELLIESLTEKIIDELVSLQNDI